VITSENIQTKLDGILPYIQKPGRYTGGELNQVVKAWQSVRTHVALVFPDIYEIGMSNLGLAILYDLINQRHDALAERAFSPGSDMEAAMRRPGCRCTRWGANTHWQIRHRRFLAATGPLPTLWRAGLANPHIAADRDESHPLVIAGSHSTSIQSRCMPSSMHLSSAR
jgi:hypothetical protein